MRTVQMQQKLGLVSLVLCASLLSSCGRAPKTEVCIIGDRKTQCHYDKTSSEHEFSHIVNWPCLSPRQASLFLQACREGRPTQVSPCIASEETLTCVDGSEMTIIEAMNWVCLNPFHLEKLLKWCMR